MKQHLQSTTYKFPRSGSEVASSWLQARFGFSLLELIIAIGIFGMAAVLAAGSLLTLVDAQKKAAASQNAMDNIRFALEAMAKEIRTGSSYTNPCKAAGDPVDFPCSSFQFSRAGGGSVTYSLVAAGNGRGVIEKSIDIIDTSPMTDDAIDVKNLDFWIVGEGTSDGKQPFVTIVIKAVANEGKPRRQSNILLQTTVSQRKIDG